MSTWPTHTDYQDSIQNPHICFEDETLKSGEVGCDMLGLPKVTSGNFACVYSLTTDEGRYAIRCFVRQVLGQQGRYARLAQHLLGLGMSCMVDFEYILRGIKVANEWYPVVKMQWVDGLPLNQYLDEHIDDSPRLLELAERFPKLMEELRANDLAHCDLQHGNIMVTPENEFKLVDYDGMYTPAFRGKSPELGHANFQHPRRTPDFYNEQVDNFSAIVIYMSLLVIADDPAIFKKYYAADNLLLTSADYRNPKQSEIIKVLKEHKNEKVKALAALLERCCLVDVSKVPEFADVVTAVKNGTVGDLVKVDINAPTPSASPSGGSGWWEGGSTPAPSTGSQPSPVEGSRPAPQMSRPADAGTRSAETGSRPATPISTRKPTYANAGGSKPGSRGAGSRATSSAPTPDPIPQVAPAANGDQKKLFIALGIGGVCIIALFWMIGKFLT